VDGMVYPPVSQGRTTLALEGLEQGREYVVDLFANLAVEGPSGTGSIPQRLGVLFVAWPAGGTERVYGYYAPGDPVMRIGLRGGKADTRWTVRLSSDSDSQDYTATGSDTEVDVDLSGGRWTGQVSVHMYHADGPGGLERPLLGTEIAAPGQAGFTGNPEDDADGPDDAFELAGTTEGASSVNLILNGQLVTPTTLPSFLNGQNPFSYSLIKGKPNGTTKKTVYSFKTSTNSFSLATCNAAVPTKPLNWSIQVDPNSIPQNLVMMSAPQVTGGQTCSAGATGSCKKPTQMCFYGDAYTSPSTIALTSSAPSWTVNMCSAWKIILSSTLVMDDGNYTIVPGTMKTLPAGGLVSISGPINNGLPVTNGTVTTSTLRYNGTADQLMYAFRPGSYTYRYNGVNGPLPVSDGYTYYFLNMIIPATGQQQQSCDTPSACMTTGVTMNYTCTDPFSGQLFNNSFGSLTFTTSSALYDRWPKMSQSQRAVILNRVLEAASLK
jgi:hypothetical protein